MNASLKNMQLIQLLLPLRSNDDVPFPQSDFSKVAEELKEVFGGVTFYDRSPARGIWTESDTVYNDDVIIYEVMAANLDIDWWSTYRQQLERRFKQDEVVIRATTITRV